MLFADFFKGRELVDTRIVDQNVELPKRLFRFGKEALHIGGFRHVSLDCNRLAALAGNFRHDAICAFAAGSVVDYDRSAFCSQTLCDACANALRCSGNNGDFSLKLAHLFTPESEISSFRHFDDYLIDGSSWKWSQISFVKLSLIGRGRLARHRGRAKGWRTCLRVQS